MNSMLNVSASPHIRSNDSVRSIMEEVIIALIPATLFGVYNFGLKAALIILTCVVTCILTEYVYEKCMKKDITTSDMSAFLTGLLLALNLSPTVPLWIPIIGGVFAILIVHDAHSGSGLAGVEYAGICALKLFNIFSRHGGNAAHALHHVEHQTLCLKQ